MDLTETIAPRSDQLNAEDLLSGPRTFTIREVRQGASAEQPVDVELVEFPGRPFKPSKTVRRLLVAGWGKESDAYAGRRLTLYRDPTVRFGKDEVGGIRVSHMSHLESPLKLALTVKRGQRAQHVVEPLVDDRPAGIAGDGLNAIAAGLADLGITDRGAMLAAVRRVVGRDLGSARDLTAEEGAAVLTWIGEQLQPEQPSSLPVDEPDQQEPDEPDWPEPAAVPS